MKTVKIGKGIAKQLRKAGIVTVEVREYSGHSGVVIDTGRDDADICILSQFGAHTMGRRLPLIATTWGDSTCYRIGGSDNVYPQIMACR
jgi:hypothetical protein